MISHKVFKLDDKNAWFRTEYKPVSYETKMICDSHHLVENNTLQKKDLYMNDEVLGPVRPEPRTIEIQDNKRNPDLKEVNG